MPSSSRPTHPRPLRSPRRCPSRAWSRGSTPPSPRRWPPAPSAGFPPPFLSPATTPTPSRCSPTSSPLVACAPSTPAPCSARVSWRPWASCRSPLRRARRSPGRAGSPSSPDDRHEPGPPAPSSTPRLEAPAMNNDKESYVLKQFSWTKDLAVLAARVALGVVFVAHGAQKLFTWGLSGTADAFAGMGVPAPQASALFAALVELVGGAALVLGVATPIAGLLLALDML